ncbi:MAG: hypothetical protein OEV30_06585 [Ignavibacteria bacterium]|nr:hypothetical protein [Ignavibacteria bacterium]
MNSLASFLAPVSAAAGLCSLLLIGGCAQERKMEPVPVGEMVRYQDPGIGFSLEHPAGWIINAQVGRVRMYNAAEVDQKYIDPAGVGVPGVEISVDVVSEEDPAGRIQTIKADMAQRQFQLGQEAPVMMGQYSGIRLPYTANYGGSNIINGHRILIAADTVLYDLGFSGFGDHYAAYTAVFDSSFRSFTMPKLKVPGRDETLPSEEFTRYVTDYFSFEYPDNFNFESPKKGKNDLVVQLRGVRQDCSIRFDVFGAEGLDVDKVFEQNKGNYRGASSSKVTIAGQPAWRLTYSPTASVERHFYFVVRNDKVIRTTLDLYKPQRADYMQAYDRVIGSIRWPG